jgi:hypothetical protein
MVKAYKLLTCDIANVEFVVKTRDVSLHKFHTSTIQTTLAYLWNKKLHKYI